MKLLPLVFGVFGFAACAAMIHPGEPGETPPGAVQLADASSGQVDMTCSRDSDCAVKNVGNCCGYFPACVNKDSRTFPDQVKAQCEKEDRMSVCGFREITGCICVEGQCSASAGAR